jgi:hypothetical protein
MPADGQRDIPDVSLFASSGFNKSAYVVCRADALQSGPTSCNKKASSYFFLLVGGTSASAPIFDGIMALANQSLATAQNTAPRQGNANYVLYQLGAQQYQAGTKCVSAQSPLPAAGCTFNDIITGTIAMACSPGSASCITNVGTDKYGVLNGYNAGTGYDLATGLGSVNVVNLVNNWSKGLAALKSTTTALMLNNGNAVSITHGASVPVAITVSPSAATGTVALVSKATVGAGIGVFTLTNGTTPAGATANQLSGGTYTVTAHYPGDGTYGPSDSAPVSVTVNPEASLTVVSAYTWSGSSFVPFTSGAAPTSVYLRADVSDSPDSGNFTATGTVNFVDNGSTTLASNVGVSTGSAAFIGPVTLNAGTHSIVAMYGGDPSFMGSTSQPLVLTLSAQSLSFVPITPCRVADTRNPAGAFGGPTMSAGEIRNFVIPNSLCNIPSTAAAYALNVTVVPHGSLGYLTVWPAGQSQPLASTLNSTDGRVKANAAIVPAGAAGGN